MHEATIVSSLLQILETQARQHGVTRIGRVTVRIGRLRAVEPQQLRLCFEMFAEETVAEGAELMLISVPVRARCSRCRHEFAVKRYRFDCPLCGGGDVEVISGQELYIESFEPAEGPASHR
jgi:hydrogenase nickel incorporation protein HypA/HybF